MEDAARKPPHKTPFEEAINLTGFGLYNISLTLLAGLVIIAFACVAYSTSILVPTSACELGTTATQQGVLAAMPLIGSIFGSLVWGYLGDTRGRRSSLLASLTLAALFNSVASLSVHWAMLLVFQFLATFLASGQYTLAITLLSECVPLAKRNLMLLTVSSIFLFSQGIMAGLAIPIMPLDFSYHLPALGIYWNSWRTVMLVYSVPSVAAALWLLAMEESPKFLMVKGREADALAVLQRIYRSNHRGAKLPLQIEGLLLEEQRREGPARKRDQILPLFKAPLLKYTLIVGVLFLFKQQNAFAVWMPRIMDQVVTVLQTGNGTELNLCGIVQQSLLTPPNPDLVPCALDETALLLVMAIGGLQSVVNGLLSLMINWSGRRNMVVALTATAGLSGVIVNLVPNAVASVAFFAVFLLGIISLGLYTAMCVALFPTHLRAMAVSLTLMMSRVAVFASIQILNYLLESACEAGFYVYSAIFASSALVALLLPDDRLLTRAPKKVTTEL